MTQQAISTGYKDLGLGAEATGPRQISTALVANSRPTLNPGLITDTTLSVLSKL